MRLAVAPVAAVADSEIARVLKHFAEHGEVGVRWAAEVPCGKRRARLREAGSCGSGSCWASPVMVDAAIGWWYSIRTPAGEYASCGRCIRAGSASRDICGHEIGQ